MIKVPFSQFSSSISTGRNCRITSMFVVVCLVGGWVRNRPPAPIDATRTVSLGGVVVNESAGATVTYRVYEVENLADFASDGLESESASTAPDAPVPYTTSDSNAKFFRVKVYIDVP